MTHQKNKNTPKPWKTICLSIAIIVIAIIVWWLSGESKSITVGTIVLFGIISNVFAGLAAIITMVPLVGPIIIKILSIPFFWLLNGFGYIISAIAIKKGYTREVIGHRALTIVLLIGVVIGFIIGRLIP